VTQLALDALTEAVADRAYAQATIRENAVERERMSKSLQDLGLIVFPSAANYLFCELRPDMPRAATLHTRLLLKHRILIRNCDSYEGLTPGRYLRVAVRTREENRRLVEALGVERKEP
jgi:histidinol-phosphate/aromatic aminotransferase/cobyric acid decarboxylase-like protein